MSHDYHDETIDPLPILFDGCGECDKRARSGVDALLELDHAKFAELLARVHDVEYEGRGAYRSTNEALVGKTLYRVLVLLERHELRPS